MLVHLLGILDVAAASIMVAGHYGILKIPLIYAAIFLVTKLFLWRDWLSIMDAFAAVYCVFIFFGASSGFVWFFVAYFLYKTSIWIFYTMAN